MRGDYDEKPKGLARPIVVTDEESGIALTEITIIVRHLD